MNVYTIANVLFKFGSLEIVCVEMRSKKLFKLSLTKLIHVKFRCTYMYMYVHALTHVKAPYLAVRECETLNGEYVHQSKGPVQVW